MVKRALLLVACVACGTPGHLGRGATSPSDVTTRVRLEDVPVNGSEVSIVRTDDTKVTGELLEATDDHVTLLRGDSLIVIGADEIRRATVTRYENGDIVSALAAWSAFGSAATISHGVWLVMTGPVWGGLSAGAIVPVAADQTRFASTERRSDLLFLQEYARFPQGLPPQYRRPH